jgi:hypothetical protein
MKAAKGKILFAKFHENIFFIRKRGSEEDILLLSNLNIFFFEVDHI